MGLWFRVPALRASDNTSTWHHDYEDVPRFPPTIRASATKEDKTFSRSLQIGLVMESCRDSPDGRPLSPAQSRCYTSKRLNKASLTSVTPAAPNISFLTSVAASSVRITISASLLLRARRHDLAKVFTFGTATSLVAIPNRRTFSGPSVQHTMLSDSNTSADEVAHGRPISWESSAVYISFKPLCPVHYMFSS